MKKLLLLALAAGTTFGAVTAADARDGCGPGGWRGPHGHCHSNGGPGYVAPGLIVGNYYHGQGYWDGHRYYQHRDRYNNGWRYR